MEVTGRMEAISGLERRVVGWIVQRLWLGNRRGGPWDPPPDLEWDDISFPGNTGARITGRYFKSNRPRGVVVAVHPDKRYGGHWFVRIGWVHHLTRAGLDVLTFDLTGYGGSQGPSTYYAEDVHCAIRFATKRNGHLPVHVFGVSVGAYAAAIASPWMENVEGLVLESPYPDTTAWYGAGIGALISRMFNAVFRKTARYLQADNRIQNSAARQILVVASTDDTVTPPHLSRRVAQSAPTGRTRYLELTGFQHLGFHDSEEYKEAVLRTFGLR